MAYPSRNSPETKRPPAPILGQPGGDHEQRDDEAERALGENPEPHDKEREPRPEKPPASPGLVAQEKEVEAERRREAQKHVGLGDPGLEEILVAHEEDRSRHHAGPGRSVDPPAPETDDRHACPGRQRRGKAGQERGHASVQVGREGDQPEEQGRLVDVDLAVEARDDPVPRPDHLPGDFGVAEVSVVFQAPAPEVEEEDEPRCGDESRRDPLFPGGSFFSRHGCSHRGPSVHGGGFPKQEPGRRRRRNGPPAEAAPRALPLHFNGKTRTLPSAPSSCR